MGAVPRIRGLLFKLDVLMAYMLLLWIGTRLCLGDSAAAGE